MKSCKILMPIGSMGGGIREDVFENGLAMKPDVIAIDAGSTDSGPAYLANAMCKYSIPAIRHDLEISILGAKKLGIPLLIGSCGTCGADKTVDETADIAVEILRKHSLKAKIAKVYSQQSQEFLEAKYREGKIHPLDGAPEITVETFSSCENIVALMGAEPIIEALNHGADIVLCGRTTDTAIIAALPLIRGLNEAAAWHGAKTVECGAQCTDESQAKGVVLEVDETGFYVRPLLETSHCTPYSVSAHLLYENIDPFRLTEPSGCIVTTDSVYTQVDEQTVYVTGTRFEKAKQYTMKLEGAAVTGYQSISLVGIADRDVTADPEKWIRNISEYAYENIRKVGISPDDYSFNFKAYGYNAVLAGPVPEGTPTPREIGMLFTVTAKTQNLATQIAKLLNAALLHFPADVKKQMPSFAFPFSPADCPRGATYEFRLHHVVDVDNPFEPVRFKYMDV